MISLYLTVALITLMIAYAGFENTIRLFAWLDLQLRYVPIRIRMEFMKRKLRRQLFIDREELLKRVQENAEGH